MRITAALSLVALAGGACAHATPTLATVPPPQLTSRERPVLLPCPWPTPPGDTIAPDPSAPPTPSAVIDPPRRRIPDCAPPGWQTPAQLRAYTPPAAPSDRPRPVVDDYLKYVVTAPPLEIVQRYKLDTTFYKKYADASGYPILASARVSDAALAIVRDQVNYMLANRPAVRDTMVAHGSSQATARQP